MRPKDISLFLSRFGGFNLRREAAPHATSSVPSYSSVMDSFQSQTRSRSTCDCLSAYCSIHPFYVSISDEKPLHMRHHFHTRCTHRCLGFNLRREAAPHATWIA